MEAKVVRIGNSHPALVVSPDEMNQAYAIRLQRKTASVVLGQIRTVSVERLLTRMTTVDPEPALAVLREMYAD